MFAKPMSIRVTFGLFVLLNCFARTLAVPTPVGDGYGDSEVENGDYKDNHVKIRKDNDWDSCNLDSLKLPLSTSPNYSLTPPPKPSKVVAVVLGVGTQNYTCSSPTGKPTPNGAIATLYDITCLTAEYPEAAHIMSKVAMRPPPGEIAPGLGFPKVGEHYFAVNAKVGGSVAIFKLNAWGKNLKFEGGRLEGIPAPADALEGSVDWLKLGRKAGIEEESRGIKFVYRVHTAGGKAPATCEGLQAEHTVHYATEYWFFN